MSCGLNPNARGNSVLRGFVLPLHQRQWGEAGEGQSQEEQSHGRLGAAGGRNVSSGGALDSLVIPKPSWGALDVERGWMGQSHSERSATVLVQKMVGV